MKRIDISQAEKQLSTLVDEVAHGTEVVITREGESIPRLVPAQPDTQPGDRNPRRLPTEPELTEEQIARRRQAIAELREMARKRGLHVSHEEIKSWIEEGRH